MPQAETLVILIRNALLALNLANQTGNYTVLRDMAAPGFREANTAARLGQIFQSLRDQGLDLSPVAIVPPQIDETPVIDSAGMLNLVGHFPTQPLRVNFKLQFQPSGGQWRLFGLSVATSPAPAAAAPVATAPAKGATAAPAQQTPAPSSKPAPKKP